MKRPDFKAIRKRWAYGVFTELDIDEMEAYIEELERESVRLKTQATEMAELCNFLEAQKGDLTAHIDKLEAKLKAERKKLEEMK